MKKMLITGGTVFLSRYAAQYFSRKFDVYVLNRNTRPQCDDVTLIEADRHALGDILKEHHFHAVLDITAYKEADVNDLLDALGRFDDYILISSSAVYPETEVQPFTEQSQTGLNRFWGKYGTDKIAAEQALLSRVPNAYILRPPYLYGPGNNVYREAFVFDCAEQGRPFYLPGDGSQLLQFFHVDDLCRFVECLLNEHPDNSVFNVGNPDGISIKEWVSLCYQAVGKQPAFIPVSEPIEQRNYFPFYNYEYYLSVETQCSLMAGVKEMYEGLKEAYAWYEKNTEKVNRKPLFEYIDRNLKENP